MNMYTSALTLISLQVLVQGLVEAGQDGLGDLLEEEDEEDGEGVRGEGAAVLTVNLAQLGPVPEQE